MHPNQALAQYFLQEIHQYYPIGLPHFASVFPGFQRMESIQREKFVAIESEEPNAWTELVETVRSEWAGYGVFNSVAAQFPCYELNIMLSDETKTGLKTHCSLTLSVSLLVKYFAIVIVDGYSYLGPKHSGVSHKFVCSGFQHHLELDSRVTNLMELVENYFQEHKYCNHEVLFNYKILGGYPYKGTYEDVGEYTIYDYLFSGSLFKQRYTVAH